MSKPSLTSQIIEAAQALDDRLKRGRAPFTTTAGVIEALGGVPSVAKLTGSNLKAVGNWPSTRHFPARFYVLMLDALHERGLHAPAWLWGMETSPDEIEEDKLETEVA